MRRYWRGSHPTDRLAPISTPIVPSLTPPARHRKGGGTQRVKARLVSIDDHLAGLREVEPKVVVEYPRFNPVKLGCKSRDGGGTDQQVCVICVLLQAVVGISPIQV